MAGRSCTRLLAVSLLIFVMSTSLRGQAVRFQGDRVGVASRADYAEVSGPRSASMPGGSLWRELLPDELAGENIPTRIPRVPIRRPPFPIGPGTTVLSQVTQAAGTIFSGTVKSVAGGGRAASGQSLGTMAITFHVERAIRGVTAGQDLTIHEWLGLWTSGQHYRVGERVLLFLFPPSRLGLTSAAGGSMGRFGVDPAGRVIIGPHLGALETEPVLAGRSRVDYEEFVRAIRRAGGTEQP
jgi:hypothetical protein